VTDNWFCSQPVIQLGCVPKNSGFQTLSRDTMFHWKPTMSFLSKFKCLETHHDWLILQACREMITKPFLSYFRFKLKTKFLKIVMVELSQRREQRREKVWQIYFLSWPLMDFWPFLLSIDFPSQEFQIKCQKWKGENIGSWFCNLAFSVINYLGLVIQSSNRVYDS